MVKKFGAHVTIGRKRWLYSAHEMDEKTVYFECKGASIGQPFLKEDLFELLVDLPELIVAEQDDRAGKGGYVQFRAADAELRQMKTEAVRKGYSSLSAYLRELVKNDIKRK